MKIGIGAKLVGSAVALFALAACGGAEPIGTSSDGLAGATFTTFDENRDGCLDSPNGVNCNHYTAKNRVYLSGGPPNGSLDDGEYFFAILAPGNPHSAISDSAPGNLSAAAGSPMIQRRFRISNGDIVPGSQFSGRGTGESPNGRFIIQAIPFADTPNPGGVYILAVCSKNARGPRDCKYDAFKVEKKECPPKKDKDCDGKDKYDWECKDKHHDGKDCDGKDKHHDGKDCDGKDKYDKDCKDKDGKHYDGKDKDCDGKDKYDWECKDKHHDDECRNDY